jgi:hypothetical protein
MIQFGPLIASAVQSIFYKAASDTISNYNASIHHIKPKLEPRVKLEGKKTYIGIAVLLASALVPQLGISEGEVTNLLTALGTAAGVIMAIYGRRKANK